MTVSADGQFVESDPGIGIRQPGWHGTQPGTAPGPAKPNPACDPKSCALSTVLGLLDCGMSFIPFASSATCLLFAEGYGTTALGSIACSETESIAELPSVSIFWARPLALCMACRRGVDRRLHRRRVQHRKKLRRMRRREWTQLFFRKLGTGRIEFSSPGRDSVAWICATAIGSTVAQWQQAQARLQAHVDFLQGYADVVNLYLGSSVWTSAVDLRAKDALAASAQLAEILGRIAMAVATPSDGGALMTPVELAAIKLLPKPGSVSDADIDKAADYLNRTTTLYRQGVEPTRPRDGQTSWTRIR